jgi:hypothetical protein
MLNGKIVLKILSLLIPIFYHLLVLSPINPLHPLVCRKGRLKGAVLRMRPEKRGPVSQQVWHDTYPSLLQGDERQV